MRIAGGNETIFVPNALKDDTVSRTVPGVIKTGTARSAALPRVKSDAEALLVGE